MKVKAVLCPRCGELVYSRARHDMRWCSCNGVAMDGGREYTRIAWSSDEDVPAPRLFAVDIGNSLTDTMLYQDWSNRRDKYGIITPEQSMNYFHVEIFENSPAHSKKGKVMNQFEEDMKAVKDSFWKDLRSTYSRTKENLSLARGSIIDWAMRVHWGLVLIFTGVIVAYPYLYWKLIILPWIYLVPNPDTHEVLGPVMVFIGLGMMVFGIWFFFARLIRWTYGYLWNKVLKKKRY